MRWCLVILIAIWEFVMLVYCAISTRIAFVDNGDALVEFQHSEFFGWMRQVVDWSCYPVHALFGERCYVLMNDGVFLDWAPILVFVVLELVRQSLSE